MAMGEPSPAEPPPLQLATCAFDLGNGSKCQNRKLAKGYCSAHYFQLRRAGAFADHPVKQRTPAAVLASNIRAQRRAQRKLEKLAPDFVDHLYNASTVAAQKGDSAPAQWALLHSRAVQPLQNGPTSANSLTVNVGVKVDKEPT